MTLRQIACLVLCTFVFISCEKYEELTGKAEFLEPGYFGICFTGIPAGLDNEVIITDNESYLEYFNQKRIHPVNLDCDTAKLPGINFNKYSLIGKYTQGGGCDVNYHREIIDNKSKNKIVYTIKAEYTGNCSVLIFNMNWALIPRLKENYNVEFIVE
jgi:hypothetical protein